MSGGVGRLDAMVYDCADPPALGDFYAALLGRDVLDAADDWVTLSADPPDGPRLAFQRVDGYQPPRWPGRRHPQQAHLDIEVAALSPAGARAVQLGARAVSEVHGSAEAPWQTYVDPAGHPFCLVTKE
jgi:hypothetical protein